MSPAVGCPYNPIIPEIKKANLWHTGPQVDKMKSFPLQESKFIIYKIL
jgi:hypothetical protein